MFIQVVAARKRLFGRWEMNYLAYNMGHDLKLPHSVTAAKIPYFKYEIRTSGVKT